MKKRMITGAWIITKMERSFWNFFKRRKKRKKQDAQLPELTLQPVPEPESRPIDKSALGRNNKDPLPSLNELTAPPNPLIEGIKRNISALDQEKIAEEKAKLAPLARTWSLDEAVDRKIEQGQEKAKRLPRKGGSVPKGYFRSKPPKY